MNTNTRILLTAALLFAACTPPPPAAPAPAGSGSAAQQAPLPSASPPTPADAPTVLLSNDAQIAEHPGTERATLYDDGTVVFRDLRGTAELTNPSEYFFKTQAAIRVVELDRQRGLQAVLVVLPDEGEEDPPSRYQLFVPSGGALRPVLNRVISPDAIGEPRFPGDGTLRYTEDGWTACKRAGFPSAPVTKQTITLRLDGSGMREAGRAPATQVRCDQLAACPFVYVVGDDGAQYVGEILRNLRSERDYGLQSLGLPAAAGSTLSLRLAEEKFEVTYLDEVYLEVGGARVEPRACAEAAPPAYCSADQRPQLLHRGDVIDLKFDLPPGGGAPVLYARGYYVPLEPTSAGR